MWREPAVRDGKLVRVQRTEVLGSARAMTKGEARRALEAKLHSLNDGVFSCGSNITFAAFVETWRQEILPHYRSSTRSFYAALLTRCVTPYFAKFELKDITARAVREFINRYEGYSLSTLRHIRATLSIIFERAVKWGYMGTNPAKELELSEGILGPDIPKGAKIQ